MYNVITCNMLFKEHWLCWIWLLTMLRVLWGQIWLFNNVTRKKSDVCVMPLTHIMNNNHENRIWGNTWASIWGEKTKRKNSLIVKIPLGNIKGQHKFYFIFLFIWRCTDTCIWRMFSWSIFSQLQFSLFIIKVHNKK